MFDDLAVSTGYNPSIGFLHTEAFEYLAAVWNSTSCSRAGGGHPQGPPMGMGPGNGQTTTQALGAIKVTSRWTRVAGGGVWPPSEGRPSTLVA